MFRTLLISACLVGAAHAQFSFQAPVGTFVGNEPEGVVIADLDGDGDLDVAATSDLPDKVTILRNDGSGGFGAPTVVNTGGGTSPHALVAADLDGDGDLDLAVTLKNVNQVRVIRNNGGAFALAGTTGVGVDPRDLRAGDLDGDGDIDLVSGNRDGNSITVLLNGGAATFAAATTAIAGEVRGVALGRFDGDADLDLAVSNQDQRRIELRLNTGAGSFVAGPNLSLGAQVRPEGLVVADLDGDGDTDLAAAGSGGGLNVATVFVRTGPGSFAGPVHYAVGGLDPSQIAAADLDADGDVDLATINTDSNNLSLLPNVGGATFGAATQIALGAAPQNLATGDLDGNGGSDLAVTREGTNDVAVLLNQAGGGANFTNLGFALAGTSGLPALAGSGTLVAGDALTLSLTNALPNTTTFLVVGLAAVNLPFNGGTLVPAFEAPFGTFLIRTTNGVGSNVLAGPWLAGVPTGTDFYFQHWIVDAGGPFGFAASNALVATTP